MAFGRKIGGIVESMRIRHWVKNFFVFSAPLFGKKMGDLDSATATCMAFLAFCLASSAVYLFNDLIDLRQDRIHPLKKRRPLASARITKMDAVVAMLVLAVLALVLSATMTSAKTTYVLVAYILANIAYSTYLKHLVIIDVMFIALGFIMRIMAGAFAGGALPSYWLILCTLNVSLFLGFGKRRHEIITLEKQAINHRRVLEHYSERFLDQMISIVTATTLVCYMLYTVDDKTVDFFDTHLLVATVPFVLYGVLRYLYLTYHMEKGGNPARTVLADMPLLIDVALWVGACVGIIYYGRSLSAWLSW